ncbi:MAG TPA: PBP1A family penicillin-binding protein [Myxococcales bacterium]|nr:PBP1A family penicillin-binding protein [Myxococcales bacterium]
MRNPRQPEKPGRSSQRDFASRGKPDSKKGKKEHARSAKQGSGGRSGVLRWLVKWGIIASLMAAVCAVLGYWGLVFYFEKRLPEVFRPDDYVARTAQLSRIYGSNGVVLGIYGHKKRSIIPSKDIPKRVKQAVLAAEDADFYKHGGLDYWGMARAMYKNIRDQRFSQGASTITQQVAKTFYLSAEKTIDRKLKEVVLTRELERKLSKDEILYLYLNQIYWGHGRWGVGEAARFYFGKPLSAVTLADAALLAGMIAAPERYSPFRDERKAAKRRSFVLDQMVSNGFVSSEDAEKARKSPIRLNFKGEPHLGLGAYAMDMVRYQVAQHVGSERLEKGGLKVVTTLHSHLQREAEKSVQKGLRRIDRDYNLGPAQKRISKKHFARRIKQMKARLRDNGVRSGEIVLGLVTKVDSKSQVLRVDFGLGAGRLPFSSLKRYVGNGKAEQFYHVGDVIRVSPRESWSKQVTGNGDAPLLNIDQGPQGALVAIDPKTRHIKALVGGYSHSTHPFNRAKQASRQAGSTFKPFVYGAVIEAGIADPMTEMQNLPESYRMGPGKYWKPRNFSNTYDGRHYTLRMALAKSINVIAVKALENVGMRRFIDFSKRVGIHSNIKKNLSVALGSTAVSPLELTNAYTTFASGGLYGKPILVTRIEDQDGRVLYKYKSQIKRVITPKLAFRVTEMMRAVVQYGTGKAARAIGHPAAGKTGTTDNGIDTWFAGYTPSLVTTVWVGFDDRRPLRKATGGKLAAPIWSRFMTAAMEGRRVQRFRPPDGVGALPPPRLSAKTGKVESKTPKRSGTVESGTDGQLESLYGQ